MTGLVVQGIRASFCFIPITAAWPLSDVRGANFASPVTLTTFIELSGDVASRPKAGPLPLMYPLGSHPVPAVPLQSVARSGLSHARER
jgi:hypothetical protein